MPDEAAGRRGLKRAPALIPLSRDHHFALIHALGLRRAAAAAAADAPHVAATARAFLAFYEDELRGHFSDEEETLLPLLEEGMDEAVARVRAEHVALHALAAALKAALAEDADLRPTLQSLGDALHDHVRFEERVAFEAVQEHLSAAALDALGLSLVAHREARGRGEGCLIVPPVLFSKR